MSENLEKTIPTPEKFAFFKALWKWAFITQKHTLLLKRGGSLLKVNDIARRKAWHFCQF